MDTWQQNTWQQNGHRTGSAGPDPLRFPTADWAQPQTFLNAALERRVAERTAALQAAWQREHDLAETLTRSLLLPPATLRRPGLSAHAFYKAASPESPVGGDFYDFLPINGAQIGIALGDVCGKGLAAAAHVPAVKFALRAFLSEHACPAYAMARLNDLLCRNRDASGEAACPIALSLVVLNRRTGAVSCAVAGAEPPLVLRAGGTGEALVPEGLLLGVQQGAEYGTATARLAPSDVLLMVTDGITEARRTVSGRGRMFGPEGVMDAAGRALRVSSHWSFRGSDAAWEVGHAVFSAARAFCGGRFHDDACALAARLWQE